MAKLPVREVALNLTGEKMGERIESTRKWVKNTVSSVWRHRVSYACLAATYGAGCFGIIDKEQVAEIAAGIYTMMTLQRH